MPEVKFDEKCLEMLRNMDGKGKDRYFSKGELHYISDCTQRRGFEKRFSKMIEEGLITDYPGETSCCIDYMIAPSGIYVLEAFEGTGKRTLNILQLMENEHKEITATEVALKNNISVKQAEISIKRLLKNGRIKFVGNKIKSSGIEGMYEHNY
jgi:hypothetical protein